MSNQKGFIFDLDGVIVDTAKYHYLAWKKLADSYSIPFSEIENEQLKGVSRIRSLEKILELGNKTISAEEFNEVMAGKNVDYLSHIEKMDASEILPEVERVLNFLKDNNQKIALGSASKNARTILEKVGLLEMFEIIVDGTNVSKAKPDPEVFTNAAKGLNVEYKNCIVFEDALAGIEAANIVGMTSIGIGKKDVLTDATYVFKDFTEMSNDFLEELINQ